LVFVLRQAIALVLRKQIRDSGFKGRRSICNPASVDWLELT
jgi:hypothetical protein